MNTLVHKAQKESVALLVNRIMAEKNPEDRKKTLKRLTTIMETFFGDLFEKESFDKARKLIDEDGKWFQVPQPRLGHLKSQCRPHRRHGPRF